MRMAYFLQGFLSRNGALIRTKYITSMTESKVIQNGLEVYIRKSDLDDIETINALIDEECRQNLNKLYDYPNVLNLLEK